MTDYFPSLQVQQKKYGTENIERFDQWFAKRMTHFMSALGMMVMMVM